MAITYAIAPICLISLRKKLPHAHRPFRLPCARAWGIIAFYFCNLIIYWSGWDVISKLGIALALGAIILFSYQYLKTSDEKIDYNWRASIWLWPYLIGISIISYYGSYGAGAKGTIPFGWDFVIIGIFSVFIALLAERNSLTRDEIQAHIDTLNLPHNKKNHVNSTHQN